MDLRFYANFFLFSDESSLSDRASVVATNSEASGFSSGSGGSSGNRKPSPSGPGALPVPIPPSLQPQPKPTTANVGGRSPKPPPLVLTTSNIPLTNGSKCNVPQTLNLATSGTHMSTGARTVGSRKPPPQMASPKRRCFGRGFVTRKPRPKMASPK